jgi:predicted DNA-binding WGR domain protein
MATRTFVLGEGGERRFWDITWEGAFVEISTGKWGTNGRASERSFETPEARDAFIQASILRATKKGYREVGDIAPAPDPAVSTPAHEREVARIRRLVEANALPAWLPRFATGTEGLGVVRGPMTLARDEAWPRCGVCSEPLSALLELDLSRAPGPLREECLVQLFGCEAWEARGSDRVCITDDAAWLARRHGLEGERRPPPASQRGTPSAITEWVPCIELPARPGALGAELDEAAPELIDELLRSVGATLDGAVDAYDAFVRGLGHQARNVHKLGGYPTFVQDDDAPGSRQLFQLEESEPFDVNFGDQGAGHLLLTPTKKLRFTWSSH